MNCQHTLLNDLQPKLSAPEIDVASASYWFTGQILEFFTCHEMLIYTTSSLVNTLQYQIPLHTVLQYSHPIDYSGCTLCMKLGVS